mmetsp:Transcript_95296/g.179174  ORF Transcript_95296/g.179174 Transcript_95296/m.179174 type:complete len:206 (+) Transcript_95296:3-620(+)
MMLVMMLCRCVGPPCDTPSCHKRPCDHQGGLHRRLVRKSSCSEPAACQLLPQERNELLQVTSVTLDCGLGLVPSKIVTALHDLVKSLRFDLVANLTHKVPQVGYPDEVRRRLVSDDTLLAQSAQGIVSIVSRAHVELLVILTPILQCAVRNRLPKAIDHFDLPLDLLLLIAIYGKPQCSKHVRHIVQWQELRLPVAKQVENLLQL